MSTIGLNIAGGEFGGTAGTHNYQYHYPTLSELQFYKDHGVDLVRLPFRWERVQDALGGALDVSGDLALIKQVLTNAASLGMDVILDNHNYGRYKDVALGAVGGPTAAQFADFWKKMAAELKDFPALLGYDLMNEPHDMPTTTIWKESAQAATDAIRQVDMGNVIYVEGTGWSGAHSWLRFNSDLIIDDPANKIVYQAHQYFDDNNSGTYDGTYDGENAYAMVGVDRLGPFVEWLEANNLKGMIGEFGVPSNDPRWLEVQKNALDYMQAHNLDGTAWGGGTWWSTTYSMYVAKPGQADSAYMNLLEKYFGEYKDVFGTSPPPPVPTAAAPTVVVNNVSANEGDGMLVFTIARTGDLSGASSVNYATADGTATAGSDYTSANGTVTFAAGQATATVTVRLTNDTLIENPESLTLGLSGGTNVAILDAQGVGTINSDDVATSPTFSDGFPTTPTISGSDGNDNINANASRIDYVDAKGGDDFITGVGSADYINGGTGTDTISYHWSGARVDVDLLRATQQNGDASGDVLVNVENIKGSGHNDILRGDDLANVINGLGGQDVMSGRGGSDKFVFNSAADANGDLITDFSSEDALDFSAFNPKFLSLTNDGAKTRIVGDTNGDGVGDFTVTLNGVHTDVNGVAVASPPPPPPPTVAINDVTVDERAGTVTFTVTRSGSLTGASSVNFATANGTATAGSDFAALNGTVSFAAGETTKTVTVAVLNDTLIENPETFTINLTGGTNVTISDAQGVGTINSEDVAAPVMPAVAVNDVAVNEAGGLMVFTLTRSGDLSAASSVNYATSNGTATAGLDYIAANGSVSFAAGQASATVTVQISNDTLVENPETFNLTLSAGTNVSISDGLGTGTINSDDVVAPPPPTVGTIMGTDISETLNGTSNSDIINALGGNDVLNGRGGADRLTGGSGSDRFVFDNTASANGDVITDFSTNSDKLDFRLIDADIIRKGDQKFTWLDTANFTGRAGQLREYNSDGHHFVAGDTNGDGIADFTLEVLGSTNLTQTDIYL